MIKTLLPMQGVQVQSLAGELRSHTTLAKKTEQNNRSHIVIHSIKTLKMVHIQKKVLKKTPHQTPWPDGEKKSRLEWPKLHHHSARDVLSGWGAGLLTGGHDPSFTSVVRRENEMGRLRPFIKENHLTFGENLLCPKYVHTCQFISFSQ